MEPNELSFEAALSRLEEIVRRLESGSAPLDESLALFEEGVGLVKLCNARLDSAEQKVRLLSKNPDGTVTEGDLPPMNANGG
ncbi:MAG: exodeoxyribonuclease VII small subunit [Clostridia bacterium]|jgi:exodeoxyribonuclease VII small subunit|nr:exodeoxyribonuclease VII small subunit [Clostridia bacterium]MBQ5356442.1 exodeoxyribonuclease VII small subunit [Clostridia bacterium]